MFAVVEYPDWTCCVCTILTHVLTWVLALEACATRGLVWASVTVQKTETVNLKRRVSFWLTVLEALSPNGVAHHLGL